LRIFYCLSIYFVSLHLFCNKLDVFHTAVTNVFGIFQNHLVTDCILHQKGL